MPRTGLVGLLALGVATPAHAQSDRVPRDRTALFADLGGSVQSWGEPRRSTFLAVGVQAGLMFEPGLRLALRADVGPGDSDRRPPFYPSLVYAAEFGPLFAPARGWVLTPSLRLAQTDDIRLGTNLGVALPLDVTLPSGLRLGLDLGVAANFGGSRYTCQGIECEARTSKSVQAAFLGGLRAGFGQPWP